MFTPLIRNFSAFVSPCKEEQQTTSDSSIFPKPLIQLFQHSIIPIAERSVHFHTFMHRRHFHRRLVEMISAVEGFGQLEAEQHEQS